MSSLPSIFVQIASYRDPELRWTIKDLFAKAKHPERIMVGVCEQCFPDLDAEHIIGPSLQPGHIKIISVLPSESRGVCWARAKTQTLYAGEDYVLMIDSHMRFIPGWDTALIDELKRCMARKAFLSTYPAAYKPPDILETAPQPSILRAKPFSPEGDIRFDGEKLHVSPPKPLRGAFLAGGFIFAPGSFIREVPYDPHLYFDHEEITLAVRAYTHGWEVYHPPGTYLYHYYHEPHKGETRILHWDDRRDWHELQLLSRARYNYLLAGIAPENKEALVDIDKYGLGTSRSLKDFETFTGIDFKNKTVSDHGLKAEFIEGLHFYRDPAEQYPHAGDKMPFLPGYDLRHFAGQKRFFCLMPVNFDDYVQEFHELHRVMRGDFAKAGFELVIVNPERALLHALGIEKKAGETPFSYLIGGDERILFLCDNRNAHNHIHELLSRARTQ